MSTTLDYFRRPIKKDSHVFYNGYLYRVTRVQDSYVWLQYVFGGQLVKPKKKWSLECLLVPEQDITEYLLKK